MSSRAFKITHDKSGTPGIWAQSVDGAYCGLGFLHAQHRPLQSMLLATAARGHLSEKLWPTQDLQHLDFLVHQLNIPQKARQAAQALDTQTCIWLDAYLYGFFLGYQKRRAMWDPLHIRQILRTEPDRESILAGLMLSSYLGLAECQGRMERALIECVQHGADPTFLASMHAPFLKGWQPETLQKVGIGSILEPTAQAFAAVGGSNAWAVDASRTRSGKPMLCGDPHLQINMLPGIFFEVRARVGHDFWLGASIPGLPGIAVGRNRDLAFSGTFSCADNVDHFIEKSVDSAAIGKNTTQQRTVVHAPRGRRRRAWTFEQGFYTAYYPSHGKHQRLAMAWCNGEDVAEALGAYIRLPMAQTVQQARKILQSAHTLSLHYVLADTQGQIGHQQAGWIPKRSDDWSGLYPVDANGNKRWLHLYPGDQLPQCDGQDGIVVSANEARLAQDAGVLATMAQPMYRYNRIHHLLKQTEKHDLQSMQAIQQDVYSLQAEQLRACMLKFVPEGTLRRALKNWDCRYDLQSIGATAFAKVYGLMLEALEIFLGGKHWRALLAQTEIRVWWCQAIDRMLCEPETWHACLRGHGDLWPRLCNAAEAQIEPWEDVQRTPFSHMVLGNAPYASRGSIGLKGSIATISQGNLVAQGINKHAAIAPAYRMICDLGDDTIETTLAGGIDERIFDKSYTCWLEPWHLGEYHRLRPPEEGEAQAYAFDGSTP